MNYLLDTNVVTAILKRDKRIQRKLQDVRSQRQQLLISCITYYEIKRGLLAVNATRQMLTLHAFYQEVAVLFLDDMETIEKAAAIYAALKLKGRPIQDADILIAATAIVQSLILVSNDSDMLNVPELTVENWLKPILPE